MKINDAQEILRLAQIVDEFVDPGDDVSDHVSDLIYKRQDRNIAALDGIVMRVLREQVIQEALTVVGHSSVVVHVRHSSSPTV